MKHNYQIKELPVINNHKLITVTRRDLTPGYQSVQSSHAIVNFAIHHPDLFKQWHEQSNYLAQLSVENLSQLSLLCSKLDDKGILYVPFYEPDLDNQLTAICIEPTDAARRITSSLPLMLKELNKPALNFV